MNKYLIINKLSQLIDFSERFDCKEFGFDTEFTSLSWYDQKLIGLSIYSDNSSFPATFVQFNFDYDFFVKEKDPKGGRKKVDVWRTYRKTDAIDIQEALPYLQKIFDGAKCICANAKVEWKIFSKYGITNWEIVDDVNLMSWMLNTDTPNDLKSNARKELGLTMTSYTDTIGQKPDNIDFRLVNWEEYGRYGALDAYATYKLRDVFKPQIAQFPALEGCYRKLELPLIKEVARSEMAGVSIDVEYLNQLTKEIDVEIEKTAERIYDEVGIEFNIASSDQLGHVLFDRMNCPVIKTSEKTNKRSVDEDTLKELAFTGYDIADSILDYRKLVKLKSTYTEAIPKKVDADGRLRGSFNQSGTACITADSLVLTSDGYKRIIDCNKQTVVLNRNLQLEQAIDYVSYKGVPTKKLITRLGYTIEGTHNHQVISNRYRMKDYCKDSHQWKRLDEFTAGDRIVLPFGYRKFPIVSPIKLNINTSVIYKTSAKKGIIIREYMDEEFAEFIGIYNADGSIKENNGSFSIRISNQAEEVKSRVKYLAKVLFNIDAGIYDTEVVITSIHLKQLKDLLNLGTHDRFKNIPKEILEGNISVMKAYLKGLTLDGHVINEKDKSCFKWTITNKEHAQQVQTILLNLGYVFSLKEEKTYYTLCGYNDMGYGLLKEVGSVKNQTEYLKKTRKSSNNFRFSRFDKNCIEVPVIDIIDKVNDVYDFVLPQTHSFIANGIINHNTGRFSSSSPNLQNMPNDKKFPVKRAFVPKPGYKFLCFDWSTIEIRIMAHESGDPVLTKLLQEGRDIHQETCDSINSQFGLTLDRGQGKTINFAVLYLMQKDSLAYSLNKALKALYHAGEITKQELRQRLISPETAQKIIDGYFNTYQGFASYVRGMTEAVKAEGWVWTLGGRRRPVPELNQKKGFGFGRRKAVNCVDQETECFSKKMGWITYNQLEEGDEILTFNNNLNKVEWNKVDILLVKEHNGKMLKMSGKNHSSLTTLDHRWYTRDSVKGVCSSERSIDLMRYDKSSSRRIPLMAEWNSDENLRTLSDDQMKLLGIFMTDGHFESSKRISITQSTSTRKTGNLDEIKRLIASTGCTIEKEYVKHFEEYSDIHQIEFSGTFVQYIISILDKEKVFKNTELIYSFTQGEAMALLSGLMLGDGWKKKRSINTFYISTKSDNRRRIFEDIILMSGYSYSTRFNKTSKQWVICVKSRKNLYIGLLDKEIVDYRGTVWCPHVKNDSFVARRDGQIYVTQNTPIQGGAGDLMKLGIIKLQKMYEKKGYDAVTLLYVHDEYVIECREDQAEALAKDVQELMENIYPKCSVPIKCEGGIYDDWAGLKQGSKKPISKGEKTSTIIDNFIKYKMIKLLR